MAAKEAEGVALSAERDVMGLALMREYYSHQPALYSTPNDLHELLQCLSTPLPCTVRLNLSAAAAASDIGHLDEKIWRPRYCMSQWLLDEGEKRREERTHCAWECPGSMFGERERAMGNALVGSGLLRYQEIVSMLSPVMLRPILIAACTLPSPSANLTSSAVRLLDMCAAPGSKTLLLHELHQQHKKASPSVRPLTIIANDSQSKRCGNALHRLRSSGCFSAMVTCADAAEYPSMTDDCGREVAYDLVVADVPCSGDGTWRKSPSLRRSWDPAHAAHLHALQLRILRRGLQLLGDQGYLLYSTCSLNPVENEAVVWAALTQHDADKYGTISLADPLQPLIQQSGMKLAPESSNPADICSSSFSGDAGGIMSVEGFRFRRGISEWTVMHADREFKAGEPDSGVSAEASLSVNENIREANEGKGGEAQDSIEGRGQKNAKDAQKSGKTPVSLTCTCSIYSHWTEVPSKLIAAPQQAGLKRARGDGGIVDTMFSSYRGDSGKHKLTGVDRTQMLSKCVRVMPHDNDTGGFFLALFHKERDGKQEPHGRVAAIKLRRCKVKKRWWGHAKGFQYRDISSLCNDLSFRKSYHDRDNGASSDKDPDSKVECDINAKQCSRFSLIESWDGEEKSQGVTSGDRAGWRSKELLELESLAKEWVTAAKWYGLTFDFSHVKVVLRRRPGRAEKGGGDRIIVVAHDTWESFCSALLISAPKEDGVCGGKLRSIVGCGIVIAKRLDPSFLVHSPYRFAILPNIRHLLQSRLVRMTKRVLTLREDSILNHIVCAEEGTQPVLMPLTVQVLRQWESEGRLNGLDTCSEECGCILLRYCSASGDAGIEELGSFYATYVITGKQAIPLCKVKDTNIPFRCSKLASANKWGIAKSPQSYPK